MTELRRYWFEFEFENLRELPPGCARGCGVTAYGIEDAKAILRERVFEGAPLAPIKRLVEDVDVSTLDQGHVRPNMEVCTWRGVWFPRGYQPVGFSEGDA